MNGTNRAPNFQQHTINENKHVPPLPKKQKIFERIHSITAVAQLKNFLGLKPKAGNNLPSYSKRLAINWNDIGSNSRQVLVSFCNVIIDEIIGVIYLKEPYKLKAALKYENKNELKDNIMKLISALPSKNIQRDILLAPIYET